METKLKRSINFFVFSVAIILFITAAGKFYSAHGDSNTLNAQDPLFPISIRVKFYLVGVAEILVSAFILIVNGKQVYKITGIAWLSTNYMVYRIGLWASGDSNFCDCLGNLNQNLPIPTYFIRNIMWGILIWMLVGSYFFLAWSWFERRALNQKGTLNSGN